MNELARQLTLDFHSKGETIVFGSLIVRANAAEAMEGIIKRHPSLLAVFVFADIPDGQVVNCALQSFSYAAGFFSGDERISFLAINESCLCPESFGAQVTIRPEVIFFKNGTQLIGMASQGCEAMKKIISRITEILSSNLLAER